MSESEDQNVPQLPPGCGYEGNDFGASYPDARCYGGKLYDLDNCDDRGNLYEPINHIPCPQCRHEEWREAFREQIEIDGYSAAENGRPRECPFPESAKRYPQDGQWLKECWLRGYDQFKAEEHKAQGPVPVMPWQEVPMIRITIPIIAVRCFACGRPADEGARDQIGCGIAIFTCKQHEKQAADFMRESLDKLKARYGHPECSEFVTTATPQPQN